MHFTMNINNSMTNIYRRQNYSNSMSKSNAYLEKLAACPQMHQAGHVNQKAGIGVFCVPTGVLHDVAPALEKLPVAH
jgi:hypothetical protein